MSTTRLKRSVRVVHVALLVALSAATLCVLPDIAEAQDAASVGYAQPVNQDTTPAHPAPIPVARQVIVDPGESLWSIAQERLGPNAAPEQIASEVERIFELNRDLIGGDPSLILPGQELLVVPVSEESAAATEAAPMASAQATEPQATQSAPTEPVAESAAVERAPETANEVPASLPDLPEGEKLAPVASVLGESPAAYDSQEHRRLLGLGIIALTLLVAILIAWRLPMNRGSGRPVAYSMYQGYYANYALREDPTSDLRTDAPTKEDMTPVNGRDDDHDPRNGTAEKKPEEDPEEDPEREGVSSSERPLSEGHSTVGYPNGRPTGRVGR